MTTPSGERPAKGAGRVEALSVGALVSALVFAPLGIVLGLVALHQARAHGARTEPAVAAIVVGVLVIGAFLVLR